MFNPEDFSRHLDEALSATQKTNKEVAEVAWLQEQARQQEVATQAAKRASEKAEEERNRNLAVLELDSQLQTEEYLRVLRVKIAPQQNLQKWGPKDGRKIYGFLYGEEERKVHAGWGPPTPPPESSPRSGITPGYEITKIIKIPRSFVVTLSYFGNPDFYGLLLIKEARMGIAPFELPEGTEKTGSNDSWEINRIHLPDKVIGIQQKQQFTQALTEFYVSVKTSWGK